MITCPQCHGKRVIETLVPNMRRYGGVDYLDPHKPEKVRVDVCPTCNYAGKVPCPECGDRGYIETTDEDGEPVPLGYCTCETGQREKRYAAAVAETDRIRAADHAFIDAEKDAWETPRAVARNYRHTDNIRAGNEPY